MKQIYQFRTDVKVENPPKLPRGVHRIKSRKEEDSEGNKDDVALVFLLEKTSR